jgi:cell wall assembly regulator SMI1
MRDNVLSGTTRLVWLAIYVDMASVRQSWRTIEDVLYENAHSVYRALRNPAKVAWIHKLQRLVQAKLPADFIQSLKVHDGLRLSYVGTNRLFDYEALLPISAISREYKMMCDLQDECNFAGFETSSRKIKNDVHWRVGWVPFTDADGDKFVLDLDPGPGGRYGQIIQFKNVGGESRRVLADSFGEWLSIVASTLGKREFRLDERGSIWLQDLHLFY